MRQGQALRVQDFGLDSKTYRESLRACKQGTDWLDLCLTNTYLLLHGQVREPGRNAHCICNLEGVVT